MKNVFKAIWPGSCEDKKPVEVLREPPTKEEILNFITGSLEITLRPEVFNFLRHYFYGIEEDCREGFNLSLAPCIYAWMLPHIIRYAEATGQLPTATPKVD